MNKQEAESIYKTPEANLLFDEKLPDSFIKSGLNYNKLLLLFWLSLLYLFATLPLAAIAFLSGAAPDNENYRMATDILSLLDNLLYLYLLLMFKLLLNFRLNCHAVDKYIYIAIFLSLIMSVLFFIMPEAEQTTSVITVGFFVLMIPLGVINVVIGIKLLKLETDFRYLRLYSWSTIVAGVLLASIVLFLLAVPVGMLASYAMAMMFLTAAKEIKRYQGSTLESTV